MLERDVGATVYPASRIHLGGKPWIPGHRDRESRAARLPPHPSLHEVVRLRDLTDQPLALRAPALFCLVCFGGKGCLPPANGFR
jgi:hypothetical protein